MKTADFLKLQKYSVTRSPRWRYDRVCYLLDKKTKKLPTRIDDKLIRRTAHFLVKWNSVPKRVRGLQAIKFARQELFAHYPDLYLAYEIFASDTCEKTRCAIEARLLAGQDDNAIAEKLQTMPEAITVYEQLFFNVRDRLGNSDYIVTRVISPLVSNGYETATLDLSAKFFGYFAGPVVLDFILTGFDRNLSLPGPDTTCDAFFDSFFRSSLARRSAEAVNTFEINKFNVMQLFEIHGNLLALTAKVKEEQDNLGVIEESIDLLLKAIPWSTGKERKAADEKRFSGYTAAAGELRSSELLGLAVGAPLPDLRDLRMPDSREVLDG